ncbi:HutD/Ves family protein [Rhizobium oryzicola]|uniref:HutD family protein n=1 Tax=Rhizobium oryzicola TaxID=1232668 RepID=A0ABT8SZX8_9HYPH|nr:HutD family protein [Rhizobium oryzicola]MDO1583563.1 HutD family protein [Rhizobium oryzicola]
MRILRASDYKRMPWKNGGGETVEITVSPERASLETFDWRISMATVATDGPFSSFAGIDRTLSILSGNGMNLTIKGMPPVSLNQQSDPLRFPADVETTATLTDGPITDLNVMTRRGVFRHQVEKRTAPIAAPEALQTRLILNGGTAMRCDWRGGSVDLAHLDCLIIDPHAPALTVAGDGTIYLVHLDNESQSPSC